MKQNVPVGVAVAIIVVVALAIFFFGYRHVTGGPNADVTQQSIAHWKQAADAQLKKNAAQPAGTNDTNPQARSSHGGGQ